MLFIDALVEHIGKKDVKPKTQTILLNFANIIGHIL